MPAKMQSPRTTPRNEFILDQCMTLTVRETREEIWRRFGEDVTENAVYIVICRAKLYGRDPRTMGRRNLQPRSPWFGAPKHLEPALPLPDDVPDAELPETALPLIQAREGQCRYPLSGSGIGLIVCGGEVPQKSTYCTGCRAKALAPSVNPTIGRASDPSSASRAGRTAAS